MVTTLCNRKLAPSSNHNDVTLRYSKTTLEHTSRVVSDILRHRGVVDEPLFSPDLSLITTLTNDEMGRRLLLQQLTFVQPG